MSRRQLALVGIVLAGVAVLFVCISGARHQDTTGWEPTTAVVTDHRTVNLSRGKATAVQVQYTVDGQVHRADVLSLGHVWDGEKFVAPADTPPVGAALEVLVDPSDPGAVVTAERSREPWMDVWTIAFVGVLSLLALLCWTVPTRR